MDNLKFNQAGINEWGSYKLISESDKLIITFRGRKSPNAFGDNKFYICLPYNSEWKSEFTNLILNIIEGIMAYAAGYKDGLWVMRSIRDQLREKGFIVDCPYFWESIELGHIQILFCENPGILEIKTEFDHFKYLAGRHQINYIKANIHRLTLAGILEYLKLAVPSEE